MAVILPYILSLLVTVIAGILVWVLQTTISENKKLKREAEKRQTALEEGMVCMLRKHLMDEHEKWTTLKYITAKALENFLAMYKAYKALGGNGMIDHMEEEILNLHLQD